MSLRSKIIPSREKFGYYELKKLKEKFPNEDIDSFMVQLKELVDSGIYSNLFNVYLGWEEPVPLTSSDTGDIAIESPLLVLAYENLNPKPGIFSSDLINYNKFYYFFPFLEWVYSMNLERQLTSKEVIRLFKSSIGEKIVFNLECFDRIDVKPDIEPEFFQKICKIRWKDKKTKDLYSRLERTLRFFGFEEYGLKEAPFNVKQMEIILFLAGCSAVKEERDVIITKDIFTAFRTLFKIIKTDISKLI